MTSPSTDACGWPAPFTARFSCSCRRDVRRAYRRRDDRDVRGRVGRRGVRGDDWPSGGCCSARSWISRWSRRANRPAGVACPAPAPPALRQEHRRGEWIQLSGMAAGVAIARRRPAFLAAAVLTLASARRDHDRCLLARGYGAHQAAAVSGRGSSGHGLRVSPSGAREDAAWSRPARLEDWHRLNRTFVAISGQLHRERHRHERQRARASRGPPRRAAVLRGLRHARRLPAVVHWTRRSDERTRRGSDQRAVLDAALQSRSRRRSAGRSPSAARAIRSSA